MYDPHVIETHNCRGIRLQSHCLPDDMGDVKSLILILTYAVVLFTILVQGLTMEKIVKKK